VIAVGDGPGETRLRRPRDLSSLTDRAPHAGGSPGGAGDPRPVDSGVDEVSAGSRKEHPVDDVHDAVAGLDVGLDD
jgi:hypothetical protein